MLFNPESLGFVLESESNPLRLFTAPDSMVYYKRYDDTIGFYLAPSGYNMDDQWEIGYVQDRELETQRSGYLYSFDDTSSLNLTNLCDRFEQEGESFRCGYLQFIRMLRKLIRVERITNLGI